MFSFRLIYTKLYCYTSREKRQLISLWSVGRKEGRRDVTEAAAAAAAAAAESVTDIAPISSSEGDDIP